MEDATPRDTLVVHACAWHCEAVSSQTPSSGLTVGLRIRLWCDLSQISRVDGRKLLERMSVAPEELDRREWPRQYMQRRPLVALCSVSHISRARLMCMEDVPQKVANHKPGWSMTCLFRRARPGTWSYGLAGTWRSLIPVHLDRNNSSATSAGLVSLSKA